MEPQSQATTGKKGKSTVAYKGDDSQGPKEVGLLIC